MPQIQSSDDRGYFERRMAEELEKAARESNSDVRDVHTTLASLYRIRLAKLVGCSPAQLQNKFVDGPRDCFLTQELRDWQSRDM